MMSENGYGRDATVNALAKLTQLIVEGKINPVCIDVDFGLEHRPCKFTLTYEPIKE